MLAEVAPEKIPDEAVIHRRSGEAQRLDVWHLQQGLIGKAILYCLRVDELQGPQIAERVQMYELASWQLLTVRDAQARKLFESCKVKASQGQEPLRTVGLSDYTRIGGKLGIGSGGFTLGSGPFKLESFLALSIGQDFLSWLTILRSHLC
jgi:hypothetical protein